MMRADSLAAVRRVPKMKSQSCQRRKKGGEVIKPEGVVSPILSMECPSCASLAARVKELEEEVARKTAECIAFFDDGVEKGLRIKQLESIAKQVIHCETCGGTWYDGGLTSSCPSCRIHTLEKVVEAARVFIDEIDNGLISGTHDRRAYFIHNLRVALKEVGK